MAGSQSITRRGVMSAAGATLAIGTCAGMSKAESEDHLIYLERLLIARADEARRIEASIPPTVEGEALLEIANDHVAEVVREIELTEASSLRGLQVKARAVAWCQSGRAEPGVGIEFGRSTDTRIAASIIEAVLSISSQ